MAFMEVKHESFRSFACRLCWVRLLKSHVRIRNSNVVHFANGVEVMSTSDARPRHENVLKETIFHPELSTCTLFRFRLSNRRLTYKYVRFSRREKRMDNFDVVDFHSIFSGWEIYQVSRLLLGKIGWFMSAGWIINFRSNVNKLTGRCRGKTRFENDCMMCLLWSINHTGVCVIIVIYYGKCFEWESYFYIFPGWKLTM